MHNVASRNSILVMFISFYYQKRSYVGSCPGCYPGQDPEAVAKAEEPWEPRLPLIN